MKLPTLLASLALLLGTVTEAEAQGSLLTWERVGDLPPDARALAFDGAGRFYAMTGDGAYRLDLSGGFPGAWEERDCCVTGDNLVALGPDTLVTSVDGRTERSTDGGRTWVRVRDDGSGDDFGLHEAPPGTPYVGTLFAAGFPFAASTDRGATWEDRGAIPSFGTRPTAFVTLPDTSAYPGRLVAAALWGAAYSDDEGWTWSLSSLWGFNRFATNAITLTASPGGGERVIVVGVDALAPYVRAWHSDNGGETWQPEAGIPLPEPLDGVGAGHIGGVWGLGGARAVAVLGRGSVYGTEDGGETWTVVGYLPDFDEDTFAFTSVVGPDGRLYVSLLRIGTEEDWVWRTEQRVAPVAVEPGLEPDDGFNLSVSPNPARREIRVALTLDAPAEAELAVFDMLGRRVAVLHAGPLPVGRHTLPFDGGHLPPGVYVVRAEAGGAMATRRLTLVR